MSFESDTIRIALDELLNGRSFSICDLNNIGEAIGVDPSHHADYKFLHLLHCVKYSNMTADIRRQIPQKVMNCLDPHNKVNVGAMAKALLIEGNDHINTEDGPLYLVGK